MAQNTPSPGHCLACTVAVPLSMHRDIFIIPFPSTLPCFPHDEILDNNTKAPEKQNRLVKDTWAVLTLLLMARIFYCTVTSIYLGISQLKHRECMCAHLHGLRGEVFCWHSASSLCWKSNKSWNSKKKSTTVSHKCAQIHRDMRNTGEFMTKETALHKRNQTTQNFLMEWNQWKKGVQSLRRWKRWEHSCTVMF